MHKTGETGRRILLWYGYLHLNATNDRGLNDIAFNERVVHQMSGHIFLASKQSGLSVIVIDHPHYQCNVINGILFVSSYRGTLTAWSCTTTEISISSTGRHPEKERAARKTPSTILFRLRHTPAPSTTTLPTPPFPGSSAAPSSSSTTTVPRQASSSWGKRSWLCHGTSGCAGLRNFRK